MKKNVSVLAFLGLFAFVACSPSNPSSCGFSCPKEITGVIVSANPTSVASGGTSTLKADLQITGSSGDVDRNINWNIVSGEGTLSKSSSSDGSSITYAAPASVSVDTTVEIKATSVGDSSKSKSIKITVEAPKVLTVNASANPARVVTGGTSELSATVFGTGAIGKSVKWDILPGGAGGTLSANSSDSGSTVKFKAPNAAGTTQIRASSVQDPTKFYVVSVVTVIDSGITISPIVPSVNRDALYTFSASVESSLGGSVVWSVGPTTGVEFTPTGDSVTFKASNYGLYTITATSTVNPSKSETMTFRVTTLGRISAGARFSLAVKADGSLWTFGINNYGELGNGTTDSKPIPEKIVNNVTGKPFEHVIAVSAGTFHSLALKSDGTLWSFGGGGQGQLGFGTTNNVSAPQFLMGDVASISAGVFHSLALKKDGTLYAFGYNAEGELGDGTNVDRLVPQLLTTNVVSMSAGGYCSLVLKADGSLYAVGGNGVGELGDGTYQNRNTLVKIMDNVLSMNAGYSHSLVIKTDGSVYAFGYNDKGMLGTGDNTSLNVPIQILTSVGISSVSAGYRHSLAIRSADKALLTFGSNDHGQLGDGTFSDRNAPVAVQGMTGVSSISAGGGHTLVAKNDGTLWAFGEAGRLGDGSESGGQDRNTPVQVLTGIMQP